MARIPIVTPRAISALVVGFKVEVEVEGCVEGDDREGGLVKGFVEGFADADDA